MVTHPRTAIRFDFGPRLCQHRPIVKHAFAERLAERVSPPPRLTLYDGDIRADMFPNEQLHPHMPWRLGAFVFREGREDLPAGTHPAQVVDRLAEHRKLGRGNSVRGMSKALRFTDQQFVVDPMVRRIQEISERIIGWDRHIVWTANPSKVLLTPRIVFYNWHRGFWS